MDSKSSQDQSVQILVRSKQGIFLLKENESNLDDAKRFSSDGNLSNGVLFSNNGKYLMIQEKLKVYTIDLESDKIVGEIEGVNIQNIALSGQNGYAQLLDRLATDRYQLSLVRFPDLKIISQSEIKRYKRELWPYIKFTTDEKYHILLEKGEVKVIDTINQKIVQSFNAKSCENFTIQPHNSTNFLIVCYQLQEELSTKKTCGNLLIYDFSRPSKIIFEKPVPDASEIVIEWSLDGKSFLFIKSSTSDSSGQSYFGQSQVFLFDWKKYDFISIPTYDGPIHSVKWSPDSQYFTIISGFMPSATVLFTKEGKPQFEFGKDHRNQLFWSPLQRFILICGFGNLDGSISVWDSKQLKSVGSCKSKSASSCLWLPCGRRFITAKVTPNMNVDNAYTIFDYQGIELLTVRFEDLGLYEVLPRPVPQGTFKDRAPSPPRKPQTAQQPQKKIFIPPGGSGQQKQSEGARVLSQNETFGNAPQSSWGLQRQNQQPKESFPPGFVPPEKKEKKKRIRNKKDQEGKDDGN